MHVNDAERQWRKKAYSTLPLGEIHISLVLHCLKFQYLFFMTYLFQLNFHAFETKWNFVKLFGALFRLLYSRLTHGWKSNDSRVKSRMSKRKRFGKKAQTFIKVFFLLKKPELNFAHFVSTFGGKVPCSRLAARKGWCFSSSRSRIIKLKVILSLLASLLALLFSFCYFSLSSPLLLPSEPT